MLGALVAALLPIGCTPASEYRNTAYVPVARSLAWDGRLTSEGSLRLEGSATRASVATNTNPQLGDTALFVPSLELDALAAVALTSGIELGLRGSYADYAWRTESSYGTLPLPTEPSVWGFGPEIRARLPVSDDSGPFALSLGGNLLGYSITEAFWQLDPSCVPSATCVEQSTPGGTVRYTLLDTKTHTFLVANAALYGSVTLGKPDFGHVFFGPSAHDGFKNRGFTDQSTDGGSLERAGPVWFIAAGYGLDLGTARGSIMMSYPLTTRDSPIDYGFPILRSHSAVSFRCGRGTRAAEGHASGRRDSQQPRAPHRIRFARDHVDSLLGP